MVTLTCPTCNTNLQLSLIAQTEQSHNGVATLTVDKASEGFDSSGPQPDLGVNDRSRLDVEAMSVYCRKRRFILKGYPIFLSQKDIIDTALNDLFHADIFFYGATVWLDRLGTPIIPHRMGTGLHAPLRSTMVKVLNSKYPSVSERWARVTTDDADRIVKRLGFDRRMTNGGIRETGIGVPQDLSIIERVKAEQPEVFQKYVTEVLAADNGS